MKTGISWLDFKLGGRMLVKYPGLTAVGGLGIAVAIAIGAAFVDALGAYMDPTLPLDEGDRILAIQNWDAETRNPDPRLLHDYEIWRGELRSMSEVGAFQPGWRNLIGSDGRGEPVSVAEMSASSFRLARVPPHLGRTFLPEDEVKGSAPVVVIGYGVWKERFDADPAVVGRTLQLGDTRHQVVGVMPEGFAFPMNHEFWTPLRADSAEFKRGDGPELFVYGRLAPGATAEQAQAEITALARRTEGAYPELYRNLRPRVLPYTYPLLDVDDMQLSDAAAMVFTVSLLLIVVCANVSILVYARTANRQGEVTVRTALGASRRRIVTQLSVEALVLAGLSAAVGLVLAMLGLRHAYGIMARESVGGLPFWMDVSLSPLTVAYVVVLTLLAALIVGVLPALQATGKRLQAGLRQLSGGTGLRLGKTWTALIVLQVALSVAILPAAVYSVWNFGRHTGFEPGFRADRVLATQVGMDRDVRPTAEVEAYRREFLARYSNRLEELSRRLEGESGVSAVTLASAVPGQEPSDWIEVEAAPSATQSGQWVRRLRVDPGFFQTFNAQLLTGRWFHSGEGTAEATAVLVNRTFVTEVLGGGNALGRRVRYPADPDSPPPADVEPDRWYEIVGVVEDLPAQPLEPAQIEARMYHPLAPGIIYPLHVMVQTRGTVPAGFAQRLREASTTLDPSLRLHDVTTLDELYRDAQVTTRVIALTLTLVTICVLLLSAAGIYALISFTVTQRRREIGIRAALGAPPRLILAAIFRRALAQLGIGIVVGSAIAALVEQASGGEMMGGHMLVVLPSVAVMMLVVGLAAALGPARRGLRVEPTEALREA